MSAEPRPTARPLSTWLLAVVAPLAIAALVGLALLGDALGRGAALRAATAHLEAVRDAGQAAAEAELQRLGERLAQVAASPDTVTALRAFGDATHASERDPRLASESISAAHAALAAHLERWYAPLGNAAPPLPPLPALPPARRAIWLQAQYVAGHAPAADGAFAAVHAEWHPRFVALMRDAGLANLLLVRAGDGLVLYDAAAWPVFQTSLLDGPFASSRLGVLFRQMRLAGGSTTVWADTAPFAAARNTPLLFAAMPVAVRGELLGVLVAAFDPQRLAPLLTAGGPDDVLGLGTHAEIVLVGSDGTLRTPGRAPGRRIGLPAPVPTQLLGSGEAVLEYADADGRTRRAAVGAPGFGDLGWRAVATVDHEAASAGTSLRPPLLFAALALGAIVVAVLTLVTWWLLVPLRHLAAVLARLRPGERELRVPVLGRGEVAALATQINRVLAQQGDAAAAARRARTQDVRALADALAAWRPGEASPSALAVGELAPLAAALDELTERAAQTVDEPAVAPLAADALRAAATRLCHDAQRHLETLAAASEATRLDSARREGVAASAAALLARSRALTATARAARDGLARVAEPGDAPRLDTVLDALEHGAASAALLADELGVLAVNVALATGDAAPRLGDEARLGVERVEQMGSALQAALAAARRAAVEAAALPDTARTAERQLAGLLAALEIVQDGLVELDRTLHGEQADAACAAAVSTAVEAGRRLRQTAELVASEAAAVTAGVA